MEKCPHHDGIASEVTTINKNVSLMQKDFEYLRRDQETILSRITKHVEDAERDGGWHDRMRTMELEVKQIQIMSRWFMIGSGVIGGLLGSGATEAVTRFLSIWH